MLMPLTHDLWTRCSGVNIVESTWSWRRDTLHSRISNHLRGHNPTCYGLSIIWWNESRCSIIIFILNVFRYPYSISRCKAILVNSQTHPINSSSWNSSRITLEKCNIIGNLFGVIIELSVYVNGCHRIKEKSLFEWINFYFIWLY
jgi:hypothetical protein